MSASKRTVLSVFKALNSSVAEVQKAGNEALKKVLILMALSGP